MITNTTTPDASFQQLRYEFARLDILLHREIARQQASAAAAPAEERRSYHISDDQAYKLLQRPFGNATPPLDVETAYQQALVQAESILDTMIAEACQNNQRLRFHDLTTLLGLDSFAKDIFLICMAPALDLRYASLYGYLQDDLTRKWPSIALILDLLCPPDADRLLKLGYFTPDTPLWRQRLLAHVPTPGVAHPMILTQPLRIDEGIVTWLLLGHYQPPVPLKPYLIYTPTPNPDTTVLSSETLNAIQAAHQSIIAMYGIDATSQMVAANLIASQAERPLLTLDLIGAGQTTLTPLDAIQLLLRDALLTSAIPQIIGWDSCLIDGSPPPTFLAALSNHPGPVLIAGREQWQPRRASPRCRISWLAFPGPDYSQRERLLHHFLNAIVTQQELPTSDLQLGLIARQFQLTTDQIQDLVDTAVDQAIQERQPLQNQHLFAAARAHSTVRLTSLATKITPRYAWSDLILPDTQMNMLREMTSTIKYRSLVLEDWGVGQKLVPSTGITTLFVGPPGTGKTMAAEVIAADLGLDLYKIDLSGVVSKYIGETEKNLERIFTEADRSNAILFFDEADAIFGKRSDVKDARDRYANIEISYLLQRMESYNGVTILATNLGTNLDDAFTRRLQFRITFSDPEIEQRMQIWQTLFPPGVPRASDVDWAWLAHKFNLTGGNIRNIIVAAAYLAAEDGRTVTMSQILHATRRELQKMGRMINERDFVRG